MLNDPVGGPARLSAVASLLLLAACAAPPLARVSASVISVPASWSTGAASAGASALAQWWWRFDDPLLAELVRRALAANTDVARAQAVLRRGWALRDEASASLRPRLDGTASAQRSRVSNDTRNTLRVGLDASWDPDLFGTRRDALDASLATAQALGATLGDVQVGTAAAVALAYIALRGNQARLAIAVESLAGQSETLQLTLWRVQAGLLSSLEGEQARSAAEQTAAQLPALQGAIDQGAHALAVLTGEVPGALLATLAAPRAMPLPADDLVLDIPVETLRGRADVRAAELQVQAALSRVSGAEAARWPSLRLSGNLGVGAVTLTALGHGAAVATGVLAGLSAPLLDGGAARAQVLVQQAALEEADASHRATVLTALRDVEDALVALRFDRERLARLRGAADAAGNAALLARQRFSSGLADFQTVLETQRTQRIAQDSSVSAAVNLGASHVRLYAALGGGWRRDGPGTATHAGQEPAR